MKIFAIVAALLASVAYAAPALVEARNPASVEVDFIGAAGAEFTQDFPADGSIQKISNYCLFEARPRIIVSNIWPLIANKLSISKIKVPLRGFTGTFYGHDGSVTVVVGPGSSDVGPPQTQVSGKVYPS